MSITQIVFKQASWLAFFKFLTQFLSWASTIIVARLLVPEDYGLMEMATVLTGYAALFSELGLGAAVIQRPDTSTEKLSSVFWFTCGVSLLFVVLCFVLAHPTALIFNEPRIIPLTQTVSAVFILNGLAIVPLNLLKKKLNFKKIGFIEMTAVLTSSASMVFIAYSGGGVWTLLFGNIIRCFIRLLLIFYFQKWSPQLYFNLSDIKDYLSFGIVVAIARTFRYLFEKADRFFAGIAWPPSNLGLYSFALLLAQMPSDKIVSLIIQVSFPAFAELQNDKNAFKSFYLNINKIIAMITLPLFVGGYLAGEELIKVFLNDKWISIVFLFKMLCISQIFVALTSINGSVHNAQGRPGWNILYNGICAILMSTCFYFATQHGIEAILIPWLTVLPLLSVGFIIITILKIEINILQYLKKMSMPVTATAIMACTVFLTQKTILVFSPEVTIKVWAMLVIKTLVGGFSYICFLLIFDGGYLQKSYRMLRKR